MRLRSLCLGRLLALPFELMRGSASLAALILALVPAEGLAASFQALQPVEELWAGFESAFPGDGPAPREARRSLAIMKAAQILEDQLEGRFSPAIPYRLTKGLLERIQAMPLPECRVEPPKAPSPDGTRYWGPPSYLTIDALLAGVALLATRKKLELRVRLRSMGDATADDSHRSAGRSVVPKYLDLMEYYRKKDRIVTILDVDPSLAPDLRRYVGGVSSPSWLQNLTSLPEDLSTDQFLEILDSITPWFDEETRFQDLSGRTMKNIEDAQAKIEILRSILAELRVHEGPKCDQGWWAQSGGAQYPARDAASIKSDQVFEFFDE